MYEKSLNVLTKLLDNLNAAMFIVMSSAIMLQVFFRYVLNDPIIGSEEAARAVLIYIVLIGSATAVGNRSHMAITYFYDLFPSMLKNIAATAYFLSVLGVSILFIVYGWDLAQRTMFQTTPALQIPKGYLVYAFPIGGLLMCLYAVGLILGGISDRKSLPETS